MAKPGDEYQEIVAAVVKALDPGAVVSVGEWVEGPDGQRDMDVAIRGMRDGTAQFILIECKDWARRVGIRDLDALESKSRDLGVDCAILYSNSGFTNGALRKAQRVGIQAASAIKEGDHRVRVGLYRNLVAKGVSVDDWQVEFYYRDGESLPEPFEIVALHYETLPVLNWLSDVALQLAMGHHESREIRLTAGFRQETVFMVRNSPVKLLGMGLTLRTRVEWLHQRVRADVSLGSYDHLQHRLIIPGGSTFYLGSIDTLGWKRLPKEPAGWMQKPAANGIEISLVLGKSIPKLPEDGTPALDEIIDQREVITT
jgi:hypothetical protein